LLSKSCQIESALFAEQRRIVAKIESLCAQADVIRRADADARVTATVFVFAFLQAWTGLSHSTTAALLRKNRFCFRIPNDV
jgi:hypothetical protein